MLPTPYPELILLLAVSCPATVAGALYYSGPQQREHWHWLGLLAVESALLVCASILFPQSLEWRWPPVYSLLALPLLLVLNIAVEGLLLFGPHPKKWKFLTTAPQHLGSSLLGVTLIGIFEEVLYRGITLFLLQHSFGLSFWLAGLASNLLFATMHCYRGFRTMAVKFGCGLSYTLLFLLTSSLLPGFILHAGQNIAVIVAGYRQGK